MKALTIAGFDPSGGAGVLNDIKTFHALGVYGAAVLTALTAQNTKRVASILPLKPDFISQELELILEEEPIPYVKTGMLYNRSIVKLIAEKIEEHQLKVVVDPVLVAGCGDRLSQEELISALKDNLLPLAYVTTPNIYEAEILSGVKILTEADLFEAAEIIGENCKVIVTGGHWQGRDLLYQGNFKYIEGELIDSKNTHGSGCSYSAALTAGLVHGLSLEKSAEQASIFVKKSIQKGNYGTLNQFWFNPPFTFK